MRFKLTMLAVVLIFGIFGVTFSASAHSLAAKKVEAKKTYYHSNGYIASIWKNAKRTVYHPNHAKREKWLKALAFLQHRRDSAWKVLHPDPPLDHNLVSAFSCIHIYEGAWNANTGNGYWGGLQMDMHFQESYGGDYLTKYGTADHWTPKQQLEVAIRAYKSGRGFWPWPNTARYCHLL